MQDLNKSRDLVTHMTFNCAVFGFLLHDKTSTGGRDEEGKRGRKQVNLLQSCSHYLHISHNKPYTMMDNTVILTGSRISRGKSVHTKRVT